VREFPNDAVWNLFRENRCGPPIRESCCVGALSQGADQGWSGHCNDTKVFNFNFTWISHEKVFSLDDFPDESQHVIFLGDSVMNQNFDSFLCYVDPTDKVHKIKTEVNQEVDWWHGVHSVEHVSFRDGRLKFTLLRSYRQLDDDDTLKKYCADPTVTALVYNVGLHYNNGDKNPQSVKDLEANAHWLAREFKQHCKGVKLIIRETTPQHFSTLTGEFGTEPPGWKTCSAIKQPTHWRHEALLRGIREQTPDLPFTEVRVWDVLSPLWNMHGPTSAKDCTHYCYSPNLWAPIVNRILAAVFQG
jgi:hypothetical protein